MAQNSKIQWTHHTFNAWRGCTKVSDGCKFCYADALSKRNPKTLGIWGPNGTRVVAADAAWREPVKWNKLAEAAGERHRVFCASLADVFEGPDTMPAGEWDKVEEARKRLFDLICRTPHLDWLLLTKRPENALDTMVRAGLYAVANPSLPRPQPNLWIGTSVENQQAADERIPHLLRVPAAVRFLSVEPMLERLEISRWMGMDRRCVVCQRSLLRANTPMESYKPCPAHTPVGEVFAPEPTKGVDWVIVGGESGHGARPCNVEWIRSIVRQCKAAAIACFVKQLGANVDDGVPFNTPSNTFRDPKGGDPSEWPEDLRVRQLPKAGAEA